MNKRLMNCFFYILLLISLIFLIGDGYFIKKNIDLKNAVYTGGFYYVFLGINRSDDIFFGNNPSKEGTSDAVRYISESAGQLKALSSAMHELGIEHTAGIGTRLEEAAKVISQPNQYPSSEIEKNKEFVHIVAINFRKCWDAQYLIKSRLPGAIQKIYQNIPTQQRTKLYNQ